MNSVNELTAAVSEILIDEDTLQGRIGELGADPVSGKPMLLKDGRFGPYVTDGELNASLRSGDTVDMLTSERAAELLAARREAGPPKKRRKQR